MIKVMMAMIALAMALSVAACDSSGFAQPAPRWGGSTYPSNPLEGGGG
jgi:hypothetical protein